MSAVPCKIDVAGRITLPKDGFLYIETRVCFFQLFINPFRIHITCCKDHLDNGFHYEGKIDSKRRVALPAALRERALSFGSSNLYFQDSDSAEYYSDIFIVVDQTPRVSDLTNFNKAPE